MNKCIITIGISASGKTTWSKNYCKENNAVRINRDDIRASLFGYTLQEYFDNWQDNQDKEPLITSLVYKMANQALKQGKDVIMDATHLQIKYIKDIVKNIDGDVQFEINWFFENPDVCILRDRDREVSVGEQVIRKQSEQFNNLYNQKDKIAHLLEDREKLNFKPVVQDKNLPMAVIFDVDGTLAHMGDRSPYDWNRVCEDILNANVARIYHIINKRRFREDKIEIIICTGRDGSAKKMTMNWLELHSVVWDVFYIRKEGDCRKDSIIKREFLEDIIKNYYIVAWFDDRNQVVDMVRKSGITCFQVAEGDF